MILALMIMITVVTATGCNVRVVKETEFKITEDGTFQKIDNVKQIIFE